MEQYIIKILWINNYKRNENIALYQLKIFIIICFVFFLTSCHIEPSEVNDLPSNNSNPINSTQPLEPKLIQIEIKPVDVDQYIDNEILLLVDQSVSLQAKAVYSDGKKEDITELVLWDSPNVDIAHVNEKGVLIGLAVGRAEIYASFEGLESQPETVLVFTEQPNIELTDVTAERSMVYVSVDPMPQYDAEVISFLNFPPVNAYKFGNMQIDQFDMQWQLKNSTPLYVTELPIIINSEEFAVIRFPEKLTGYSDTDFIFHQSDIFSISYINQAGMFLSNMIMNVEKECGSSGLCYNSAKEGSERNIYDVTASTLYRVFNRESFVKHIENYFLSCHSSHTQCINYNEKLPYAWNRYLHNAIEDYKMEWKVMRNEYAAEGVGGGGGANISHSTSSSGGWASVWQNYVDENHNDFLDLNSYYYNIVFHEMSHGFGHSHKSGMTYGFSDSFSGEYLPTLDESERKQLGSNIIPGVLMDASVVEANKIKITFYSQEQLHEAPIDIQLISTSSMDYSIEDPYLEKNTIYIHFKKLPAAVFYIKAYKEGNDFFSTKKFTPEMLSHINSYQPVILYDHNLNWQNTGHKIFSTMSIPDLSAYDLENCVSSVNVPTGWKVTLWTGKDYSGNHYSFTAGNHEGGSSFSNKINSVTIERINDLIGPTLTFVDPIKEIVVGEPFTLKVQSSIADAISDFRYHWLLPEHISVISGANESEINLVLDAQTKDQELIKVYYSNGKDTGHAHLSLIVK